MLNYLLVTALSLTLLCAVLVFFIANVRMRRVIVTVSGLAVVFTEIWIARAMVAMGGVIRINTNTAYFDAVWVTKLVNLAVLVYIFYLSAGMRKPFIISLTAVQAVPLVIFEIFGGYQSSEMLLVINRLSVVVLILVSTVGYAAVFYGVAYGMHAEKLKGRRTADQKAMPSVMLLQVASAGMLVLSDNLLGVYLFWQLITITTYVIVSQGTYREAASDAARVLWINLIGGAAFIAGILLVYKANATLSIEEILEASLSGNLTAVLAAGLSLICLAVFVRTAQFPFQSWLIGTGRAALAAQILILSCTVIASGAYVIISLSPAFGGTLMGKVISFAGAFTFAGASALALLQKNIKNIIMYFVISGAGLIICCSGTGSRLGLGTAALGIVFYSLAALLLMVCVGTIERKIDCTSLEDIPEIAETLTPSLSILMASILFMLVPFIGLLLIKWMAAEATIHVPLLLVLVVVGIALAIVYWAKSCGGFLELLSACTGSSAGNRVYIIACASAISIGAIITGFVVIPGMLKFFKPFLDNFNFPNDVILKSNTFGTWIYGEDGVLAGGSTFILLYTLMAAAAGPVFLYLSERPKFKRHLPYMCGENAENGIMPASFTGPAEKVERAVTDSYLFRDILTEKKVVLIFNFLASAIIAVMFGVIINGII